MEVVEIVFICLFIVTVILSFIFDIPSKTYNNKRKNTVSTSESQMSNDQAKNLHIYPQPNEETHTNDISHCMKQPNNPSSVEVYSGIVDITPQTVPEKSYSTNKRITKAPYWPHQYVYSYSEIHQATIEQKEFYVFFRRSFLNGEYLDLEGNTNYAFILLFDLLLRFETHKNISKLENQLKTLGLHYPKTKSYGMRFLIERMNKLRLYDESSRITDEEYNYWKLGFKYRDRLNLTSSQSTMLNNISYSTNNFSNINFCAEEIIKLYLSLVDELNNKYIQEDTTLDAEFESIAILVTKQRYNYPNLNIINRRFVDGTICELHSNIFKYCENAVRELYGYKRRIHTDVDYRVKTKELYETKIISKIRDLLPYLVLKTTPPDEATEIELNTQITTRWKAKFETLTKSYAGNPKEFVDAVISLGNLNRNNPSVELVFYEASKFISRHDSVSALSLYMHYLYHDLKSSTFDNRQLTKTVQKSLFKNNEQLRDFEEIVSALLQNGDLEKALQDVSGIYAPKRKKIQLDIDSVKKVQQQHTGTVELLNEYLQDEYEDENSTIKTREINSDKIEMEITRKTINASSAISPYISAISFLPVHISILTLFAKNNLSVQQSEIEIFAKSRGLFKNQIIENINDVCYELLDDNLIEEEDGEYYTITPEYYQEIVAK